MTSDSANDRLIVALDFNQCDEALRLVEKLNGVVSFFKVGYELFTAAGYEPIEKLSKMGHRIFLDLKMDDVPETIMRSVRHLAGIEGLNFLSIHGGANTARAAVEGKGAQDLKLLQITALTSLREEDLVAMGLTGPGRAHAKRIDYVRYRAELSKKNGCDGVIGSGLEAAQIREAMGEGPLLVCPGIRPAGSETQDHAVPSTPYNAIRNGADYLVVGRPVRNAADPAAAAAAIISEIDRALEDIG